MVCAVVDSVSVPGVQTACGLPLPPGVALLQLNLTAFTGTAGQLAKEAAVALTPRVQVLLPPFMLHITVAVVFPFTGVVSGSGELKVMVDGVTVTVPVTANANPLTMTLGNSAVAGCFD
jgi:hypothetical protein